MFAVNDERIVEIAIDNGVVSGCCVILSNDKPEGRDIIYAGPLATAPTKIKERWLVLICEADYQHLPARNRAN